MPNLDDLQVSDTLDPAVKKPEPAPAPEVVAPAPVVNEPSIEARRPVPVDDGVVRDFPLPSDNPDYVKREHDMRIAEGEKPSLADLLDPLSPFKQWNPFNQESSLRLGLYNNNVATIYDAFERKQKNPADDTWPARREKWAKENNVPPEEMYQYNVTQSEGEAKALTFDIWKRKRASEILSQRTGVNNFMASSVFTLLDADTAISILDAPVGLAVKFGATTRVGRALFTGAKTAAELSASQALGESVSEVPQWSAVPMAGLLGMGLGTLLGGFSHSPKPKDPNVPDKESFFGKPRAPWSKAPDADPEIWHQDQVDLAADEMNNGIHVMKKDFGEFMATEDLPNADVFTPDHGHDDAYGSVAFEQESIKVAEEQAAAAKAAKPEGAAPEPEPKPTLEEFTEPHIEDSSEGGTAPFGGSVGAAAINAPKPGVLRDAAQEKLRQRSIQWGSRTGISDMIQNGIMNSPLGRKRPEVARYVQRMLDAIQRTPGLRTDWDKFTQSGSPTAQRVMFELGSDPSQLVVNVSSAALDKQAFAQRMFGMFQPEWDAAYNAWADANKLTLITRHADNATRVRFNEAVINELQARFHDGKNYIPSKDPHIVRAAKAHDDLFAYEAELIAGDRKTTNLVGAENLKPKSGYMSQKWLGRKMNSLMSQIDKKTGKLGEGERQVIDTIEGAMHQVHGSYMTPSDIKIYSRAIFRRATTTADGLSTNLLGMLQNGGAAFMSQWIKDSTNMTEGAISGLIKRLQDNAAIAAKSGFLHERIDMDLRYVHPNGLRLMDLVDTDIVRTAQSRIRSSSGRAALARKGIRSSVDVKRIRDQIMAEQAARGPSERTGGVVDHALSMDRHITEKDFDDFMSNFSSSAELADRNTNQAAARLRKLTNLSLLGKLGFAQAGETAGVISAVGWARFLMHAPKEIRDALAKRDSALVAELRHTGIYVPEEALNRPDLWDDTVSATKMMEDVGGVMSQLDKGLNLAARLQGIVSGFQAIKNIQNRIAVSAMTNKIMQNLAGLANDITPDRWANLGLASGTPGLNPKTLTTLKQYIANGTIVFKDGEVHQLNLHRWNPSTLRDFTNVINRAQHTMVQQALAGETNSFLHKDGIAALFSQLKSYPILALRKQFLNNVAQNDTQGMMLFLYSMAASGSMYMASQAVSGRTENITPEKVVRGAFSMSNITGWVPMMTDPVAYMFGMDWADIDGYSPRGGPINTPAAYTVANGLLGAPRALVAAAGYPLGFTKPTSDDVRNLQYIPLFGRMLGINAALNAMRPDPKRKSAVLDEHDKYVRDMYEQANNPQKITSDQTPTPQEAFQKEANDKVGKAPEPVKADAKPVPQEKEFDPVAAALKASQPKQADKPSGNGIIVKALASGLGMGSFFN